LPGRRLLTQLPQVVTQFLRDGFIDRYSGDRLIFPPVLRVLSLTMRESFPFHTNWKMSETHPAYWDLCATIDHMTPVSRGGADDKSNWATTSMARNAAKGNSTLEQIGWTLHPPGDVRDWDGLTAWFTRYIGAHPEHHSNRYVLGSANALSSVESP
jgi:HNH endonuclease